MAHVRQQIRDAVKAILTGLPTSGSHVFVMRPMERPMSANELPAVRIYLDDESLEDESLDWPRTYRRSPVLRIEAVAQTSTQPVQDVLDTMTSEIEIAMASDPTLGGLSKDLYLASIATDIDASGQYPVGVQRLTYDCTFFTKSTAPDVAL